MLPVAFAGAPARAVRFFATPGSGGSAPHPATAPRGAAEVAQGKGGTPGNAGSSKPNLTRSFRLFSSFGARGLQITGGLGLRRAGARGLILCT